MRDDGNQHFLLFQKCFQTHQIQKYIRHLQMLSWLSRKCCHLVMKVIELWTKWYVSCNGYLGYNQHEITEKKLWQKSNSLEDDYLFYNTFP